MVEMKSRESEILQGCATKQPNQKETLGEVYRAIDTHLSKMDPQLQVQKDAFIPSGRGQQVVSDFECSAPCLNANQES
ncbi:UNVERIFIED_CONTAM: hypothetical protein Sradi_2369500 [Sesamum radiatum]|uniref:Uncharacterized protein n=1 Tax=Sesamum radiatum TaxID=300843 RepID=A0AAW2T6M0_SESRA